MSKAEAIKKTGYTENELIYLGLIAMKVRMKESRHNCETSEEFEHYDALVKAFDAMAIEYEKK